MKKKKVKKWQVYLLRCSDNSFYCGITNDLEKRIEQHESGKASKYTRSRLPIKLMCASPFLTRSQALRLEIYVKRQKKREKPYEVLHPWFLNKGESGVKKNRQNNKKTRLARELIKNTYNAIT